MNRRLLIFLLSLTALRLFLGSQMELSPDETYYFQWSQRLDWAYYSKGPGVATAIWIGTKLFGPTALGVRFLSPFFALGTSLVLFALARRLYGNSVAIWSVLLLNLTPIFQAGGLVMTIDALSIFFWAAALFAFWLALERSPRFSWFWPLTGAFMGLGFLAKYTNAMELLSVVLVLALTPRLRQEFRRPGFWTMLGVFVLSALPPLVWNSQHHWITVEHLRSRGGIDGHTGGFHPGAVLNFLGLHFGVYSPLIFAAMLAALFWGCREARVHFKSRFLVLFALPLLVMYLLLAFKRTGEPNWTAPAFVSLGILTAAFWHELAQRHLAARRFAVATLALGLAMSLFLFNTDVVRQLGLKWSYEKDPTGRLRGWQTVAIAVDDLRHRLEKEGGKPLFLIANKYQTASSLSFYLPEKRSDGPGHPSVYIPESQAIENQYSFWPRYDEMIEPVVLARQLLAQASDPAKHDALAAALAAATDPKLSKEGSEADARRRALIRAMLAVDPKLPLDEYASEEAGVSLFHGRDALYITDRAERRPPTAIRSGFETVELIAQWQEMRRGLPLRQIRVFACRNYRSLSL
ncbi:MAG: glycosyltransferase family 39 protein [Verrucomicrobiota bacterium]